MQRIGIAHWQPAARLQSWGLAPLHREGNTVFVPCDATEALWLGAWLEERVNTAHVLLGNPRDGASGSISLPPDGQLTALDDALHGPQPLALVAPASDGTRPCRTLKLQLDCGTSSAAIELVMLAPERWASRSGRTPAAPRTTPPPRPPRLG